MSATPEGRRHARAGGGGRHDLDAQVTERSGEGIAIEAGGGLHEQQIGIGRGRPQHGRDDRARRPGESRERDAEHQDGQPSRGARSMAQRSSPLPVTPAEILVSMGSPGNAEARPW